MDVLRKIEVTKQQQRLRLLNCRPPRAPHPPQLLYLLQPNLFPLALPSNRDRRRRNDRVRGGDAHGTVRSDVAVPDAGVDPG